MYFMTPELLKTDYSKIEEFYKEEPKLLEHEKNKDYLLVKKMDEFNFLNGISK